MLHLATAADPEALNGSSFDHLQRKAPHTHRPSTRTLARRLWERSVQLTALPPTSLSDANDPGVTARVRHSAPRDIADEVFGDVLSPAVQPNG
ncbi:hypothetical protein [Streptomyces sp. NPDC002845]